MPDETTNTPTPEAQVKQLEASNKALQKQVADLATEIKTAAADKAELLKLNQEMQERLETEANKPQLPVKHPTFKVGKEKYAIVVPRFRHEGQSYTAAEAAGNPEVRKALVEIESGVIRKV